ncbi:hypothetical protein AOZ06_30425 [Kibdelosporangium phytohabitans]|uniref:Histidine kinase/HSP90-like ATPase domain-containing protein n=1 Tax=Kibdelosporangium phytohabitans TaxID=860235 RepID=A0A0N9I4T2_9PSEU|nr:hypothetical protein AOZ06_30425 [Kibdelosporangium phytohabitans]
MTSADAARAWARVLPAPVCEAVLGADLDQPFVFHRFAGVGTALSAERRAVRQWAGGLGLGDYGADDIVLAVDEAVTNAIEHGYRGRPEAEPGTVGLFCGHNPEQRMAYVVVADKGAWLAPSEPGVRGRGLLLMGKLADRFDLYPADGGADGGTVALLGWYVS